MSGRGGRQELESKLSKVLRKITSPKGPCSDQRSYPHDKWLCILSGGLCSPFEPSTTNCMQRPGKHSSRSQSGSSTHPSPRTESFLPLSWTKSIWLSRRHRPRTHCQCHMTKTGTHCACVFNIRYTHKYTGTSFHKFTTAQITTSCQVSWSCQVSLPQTQNKAKTCCYGSLGVRLKKEEAQETQWDGSSVLSKTERDRDTAWRKLWPIPEWAT